MSGELLAAAGGKSDGIALLSPIRERQRDTETQRDAQSSPIRDSGRGMVDGAVEN